MAITRSETGSVMITGDDINLYRVTVGLHAMAFEIKTGMKMTRGFSGIKFAQSYGYDGPKSLKKAYAWLYDFHEQKVNEAYPAS
jgi:hypothetical protein